ncbi:MAG: hypothetical protein BEN18_06270 [Epulopiscium sp. Nuni2H_MBin001]|nr:MAG: hypothetical protein BEN18_06270 [Epulopiscium sp. Nuni2H_MBin001]
MAERFSVNARVPKYNDKTFKELTKDDEIIWEILIYFIITHDVDLDEYFIEREDVTFLNYTQTDVEKLEADRVFKLVHKITGNIVYLHIEFQSKVDFTMPFRVDSYRSNLRKDYLFKNGIDSNASRDKARAPQIISAVVYLGSGLWTAANNLGEVTGFNNIYISPDASMEDKLNHKLAFQHKCVVSASEPIYHIVNPTAEELIAAGGLFAAMIYVVKSISATDFVDNIIFVAKHWGLEISQIDNFFKLIRPIIVAEEFEIIIETLLSCREEIVNMFVSVDDAIFARGEAIGEARGKVIVYYNEMNLTIDEISTKLNMDISDVESIVKNL